MLSPRQIEATLKHCEEVEESFGATDKTKDIQENDYYINQGWCEALRFVLERNTRA
jgi:hypothetical protein